VVRVEPLSIALRKGTVSGVALGSEPVNFNPERVDLASDDHPRLILL